jgi:putative acetyltransferase
MEIVHVESPQQLEQIRALFSEYFQWIDQELKIDMGYQKLQQELQALPGYYAPPSGRLLLLQDQLQAVGCIALRPLEDGACELKRMYVRPAYRGQGLGRALGERIISEARRAGYRLMRLDTASVLVNAITLYSSLGFCTVDPYYEVPPEVLLWSVFMEMRLE